MVEGATKEEETALEAHQQEADQHTGQDDNNHYGSYQEEQEAEQDVHEQKWSPGLRYDASDDVEESDAEVCPCCCLRQV